MLIFVVQRILALSSCFVVSTDEMKNVYRIALSSIISKDNIDESVVIFTAFEDVF